uniref:Uncharacterized protein n=1 Tax=Rhodnius prolixus TaxID=13249 RepID=T1HZN7_RHOPR
MGAWGLKTLKVTKIQVGKEQLYKRNTTFITEKEFYSSSDAFKYNSNEKFQIISLRLPVAHTLAFVNHLCTL